MPTRRYSRAARCRNEQIHELLLAGFSPQDVATKLGLAVEQVLAGERRVQQEEEALPPDEAARRRILLMLKAVAQESMRAWQKSVASGEETTKVSQTSESDTHKTERVQTKQSGDPRYLDRALKAMAAETRLRGLDKPAEKTSSAPSPAPTASPKPDEKASPAPADPKQPPADPAAPKPLQESELLKDAELRAKARLAIEGGTLLDLYSQEVRRAYGLPLKLSPREIGRNVPDD